MYKLPATGKVISVFFSLGTNPAKTRDLNCVTALCDLFSACKESVKISIYSLTEPNLINAIIETHKRGIEIIIIVDSNQAKGTTMKKAIERLKKEGINVITASKQRYCMHHKVAIFDNYIVATGSFNWSTSASKRNNENLILIEGIELAKMYEKYAITYIIENEVI